MRRFLIVLMAAGLTGLPLAVFAAPSSPSLTLLSPTAGTVAGGLVSVRWSYSAFHRLTPVDVEAARPGEAFRRLGRVPVDDGSPGYFGSFTWPTGPDDDGADWTVRVVAPTNKRVSSTATPVTIDNTGPTTTIATGDVPVAVVVDVAGSATDALSSVARVEVAFVGPDGTSVERVATCSGCGAASATWSASTAGLGPASYEVRAWAVDALGNVGPAATATLLIVGTPTVTPPPVTVPDVTVPDVTVPDVTVPDVTVAAPEVAPPEVPTPAVPEDPTTLVPPVPLPAL